MRLRNKKTGEAIDVKDAFWDSDDYPNHYIISDDWEDAPEEPKEYWYIDYDGGILCGESDNSSAEKMMISIGNHFSSMKEAEKAVRKLEAWKRLKDKGFRFDCYMRRSDWSELPEVKSLENLIDIAAYLPKDKIKEMKADLDLLFGGEE